MFKSINTFKLKKLSFKSVTRRILKNLADSFLVLIFKILNLTSLARVDFFVTKEKIYFNEVNTMPGFTDISMYPKMLINDGFTYTEIIDTLVDNALNK